MKKIEILIKNSKVDLLYYYDNSLPVVDFKLVFKVAGSSANNILGISKICEKILNEGTKTLGVSEYSRLLEINAVEINASSGFETFVLSINCLKEHFHFALSMLKKLLEDPNYTKETLEKIKLQTYGQIASLKSDFDYISQKEINKILHPNSSLSNSSIGTKESIEEITLEHVQKFIKEHLNISNMFIVLGGDVQYKDINFEDIFGALIVGKNRELKKIHTSSSKSVSYLIDKTEQAYIYFGAPFDVEKEEKYKATVATFILGSSGFGSRLMEEIRVKRGLAYSVYAKNEFSLSLSRIWGYMQTKNESKDEAIKVIKNEFKKFVKNGVLKSELYSAKDFLLGSVPLQKETLFKRLSIFQDEYYSGYDFGEFDKTLQKISSLTIDELNDFIKLHDEILNLSFSVLYNANK